MNTTTFKTHLIPAWVARQGTSRSAQWSLRVSMAGRWLWRELEQMGQARARSHMQRLAINYEGTRPEFARLLRESC